MSDPTTLACPHCDSSCIDRNGGEHTKPYGCKDCGRRFESAVRRAAKTDTLPRGGLAKDLLEMDHEEKNVK